MRVCPVYNLEFPSWCPELNISGYRFTRVDNYQEQVLQLQHLSNHVSEYIQDVNTGTHAITANVEIPENEENAKFEWSEENKTALSDILLLLSLFTGRDVFIIKQEKLPANEVIIADPRVFTRGGILRASIPYKKQAVAPDSLGYDIGLEEGLNKIYALIRSHEWQTEYKQGYFLLLAKAAFRRQVMEATFTQCWTIWEHLFAILNEKWLSEKQIRLMSSVEKISFLLVKFALVGEIDNASRKRIESLAEIRNRLIHVGRFPERDTAHRDALLFVHLTEFIIAKILGLVPSEVFNTMKKLEEFLNKSEGAKNVP